MRCTRFQEFRQTRQMRFEQFRRRINFTKTRFSNSFWQRSGILTSNSLLICLWIYCVHNKLIILWSITVLSLEINKKGLKTAYDERPMNASACSWIVVCINWNIHSYYCCKKFNFNSFRIILLNGKRIQDILQRNVMQKPRQGDQLIHNMLRVVERL